MVDLRRYTIGVSILSQGIWIAANLLGNSVHHPLG